MDNTQYKEKQEGLETSYQSTFMFPNIFRNSLCSDIYFLTKFDILIPRGFRIVQNNFNFHGQYFCRFDLKKTPSYNTRPPPPFCTISHRRIKTLLIFPFITAITYYYYYFYSAIHYCCQLYPNTEHCGVFPLLDIG